MKLSDILKISMGNKFIESPIEAQLYSRLKQFNVPCKLQHKIGPYRADIFIESKYRKIVIECDGKEFHQDKKREEKRDRYLESKGYLVLHFTGSEIFQNSEACVQKIIENISEIYGSKLYQDYLESQLNKESFSENDLTVDKNI